MNKRQKCILTLLIHCCECAVISKKANKNSKHDNSLFIGYDMPKEEILRNSTELQDSQDPVRIPKTIFVPFLWRQKINETISNSEKQATKLDFARYFKIKRSGSHLSDLTPDARLTLDTVMPDYLNHSAYNGTKNPSNVLLFNDENVEFIVLNKDGINESAIQPDIPDCQNGNESCEKCQDLSPLCHYMFSEGRCVYYNSTHSSKLYECGKRWFPIDKNEVFFATAAILLIVSFAAVAGMMWLQYHVEVEVEDAVDVSLEEFAEMRNIIQRIREKRLPQKQREDSSQEQRDQSASV